MLNNSSELIGPFIQFSVRQSLNSVNNGRLCRMLFYSSFYHLFNPCVMHFHRMKNKPSGEPNIYLLSTKVFHQISIRSKYKYLYHFRTITCVLILDI